MPIAVMQPYFLPYIGYFQLMATVDKFVLLDDVNYINRGWINRNRICINQQPHWFTVPLVKASQNRLISDLEIQSNSDWKSKLDKTIINNYRKTPFFADVYPIFEQIINFSNLSLSAFLYHSLKLIADYLSIKTTIIPTSSVYSKENLKGQDRIIDICVKETADSYFNLPGGKKLYDRDLFRNNNIDLYFIEPVLKNIKLSYGANEGPVLSMLDLMMWNHANEIKQALTVYQLS
ncbi:WbqC family protein [Nodularia spumigena]|uniref:WbqC family protein n=1 Tax=Nodularia spumigena UHCC 0060 TaxID=3110300 RepID=A0ABU5UWE9_NODSP|nr:WbqC family protein [Nodularia spumigena]MEA5527950.1 WbqC family protein [Nodularia spumigena UHCC 0143]MEA5610633.1 WbqC family protein [Nodularia spumigena UHCC 0060]